MDELTVIELDTPPDNFLPDEPEGTAFHRAFLASGIAGFNCRYLAISKNGLRITVVPFFLGTFSLTTLFSAGWLKKSLSWIKFRYACVGHPSTDFGAIHGEISTEILNLVNETLVRKASLIAYKGFTDDLPLPGFIRVHGLPVAVLALKGDYYSGLDSRRRNDFKHKLEKAQGLKIEECATLPEHLVADIFQLYLNTYHHATTQFERLTPAYFRETASISKYLLFFDAEKLIGFVQIIGKRNKATCAYLGMDYLRNQQYGLYYLICLKCIETCLRDGYQQLELGVTSYHFKLLLGAQLIETQLYYRHSNPLMHGLLGKLKFLLEPSKDELR